MSNPAQPTSNSSYALSRLRDLIDGGLDDAGGWLLPERELAEKFGVGCRAVRRALDVLEAEGRIRRCQGKGTFSEPKATSTARLSGGLAARTNPMEVIEARLEIEPETLRDSLLAVRPEETAGGGCP